MAFSLGRTRTRLLLGIAIFYTIVIIPFSLFLGNQFSSYAYQQMNLLNQDKINGTVERTEFILQKLKSYGLNLYEDKRIQEWLQSGHRNELLDFETLRTLTAYLANEPFIRKAYLIQMKREAVLDSQTGIQSFRDFSDPVMLRRITANPSMFLQYYNHEHDGMKELALTIPSTPSRIAHEGYLVILLNNQVLEDHLLQSESEIESDLMIMDGEGRMILGKPNPHFVAPERDRVEGTSGLAGSYRIKEKDTVWYVNYSGVASQRWTIYSMSQLKDFRMKTTAFYSNLIASSLVLLLLLLVIALWNSRRITKPYRVLADELQRSVGSSSMAADGMSGDKDEYKLLKHGIELLTGRLAQMDREMRENSNLVKSEYLRQWVLQGKLTPFVHEYLVRETGLPDHSALRLAVIKIDHYSSFTSKYDFASRKLLKYAMGEIAVEILRGSGKTSESIDMGGDHLVVLFDEKDESDPVPTLEEAGSQIRTYLGWEVTIALSESLAGSGDLRASYDFGQGLTQLKFISGENKVYTYLDHTEYGEMMQSGTVNMGTERLIEAVRSGSEEKVGIYLDEIFRSLAGMRSVDCKFYLSLLFFEIAKPFGMMTSLQSVEGTQGQIARFGTLQQAKDWLKDELSRTTHELRSRKGAERKDKVVEEILEYVQYRIHDPLLSTDDVADHVSLSSKYVRQLFQDSCGQSLSNYILDKRIRMVKQLLDETSLPVADIALRCGFQTKSHFFTAFKKATGMTPSEFRTERK